MNPIARTDELISQEVEDEIIVYDETDDTACCLNPLAATIWRLCDGRQSVEDLVEIVVRQMDLPKEVDPQTAVWRTLEDLEQHNLLSSYESTGPSKAAEADSVMSRRKAIKMTLIGLSLFPTVKSIITPTLAMADSGPTMYPTFSFAPK